MGRKRRSGRDSGDPRWRWEEMPAPGELRAVHALVKTGEGVERLGSTAALGAWLRAWKLAPRGFAVEESDLERIHRVRAALRALVAVNAGYPLDPAAPARLDRELENARFRMRVEPGGELRYEPATDGIDGVLAQLLEIVKQTPAGSWRRLKICREEECRRIYYDLSSNNTCKWCSARCGNRINARAYRKRYKRRTGRSPGAFWHSK